MKTIKKIIIGLLASYAVSFALQTHCTDFVIINISSGDTLAHFAQKGIEKNSQISVNGRCRYDTDWFGSGVQWKCRDMYLIQENKSKLVSVRSGEFSQKQFTFTCENDF